MSKLIDVEVSPGEAMFVVQRGDGTCTVSLPRAAIEKAMAAGAGAERVVESGYDFAERESRH